MRIFVLLFLGMVIVGCQNGLSEPEVSEIIQTCLKKDPIYDRVELHLADTLPLTEQQVLLYKKLEKSGLIELSQASQNEENRWTISATEKAAPYLLHETQDSIGRIASFRLSVFGLESIEHIQRIASTDVALVDVVFKSVEPTPFFDALVEDLAEKVRNQITLTRSDDGTWKWCD